jgi:putative endonuclease
VFKGKAGTKATGDAAESRALAWLQRQGLGLVQRNYRVVRGPHARGGEIDLIMREPGGEIVFVEVRARADADHGGAAASVGQAKRRRLIYAARCWLAGQAAVPPIRFDVIAIDGQHIQWIQGAFTAD